MSESPVPPPDAPSSPPAAVESLLDRLRRITGLTASAATEAPPSIQDLGPPPVDKLTGWLRRVTGLKPAPAASERPAEAPVSGPPPVDRLIPWLREAFGVAVAIGIALAVLAATGAVWLWIQGRAGWQFLRKRISAWKAGRAVTASPPATEAAPPPPQAEPKREPEVLLAVDVARDVVPEAEMPKLASAPPPVPAEPVAIPPPVEEVFASPAVEPHPEPPAVPEVKTAAAPAASRRWPRLAAMSAAALLLLCGVVYFVKPLRYAVTGLLGRGNAAVVVGQEGWLFPRDTGAAAPRDWKTAVTSLQSGGATVLVLSLPSKAAVYPDKLDAAQGSGLKRAEGVAAAHQAITAAGARILDLGPVLHAMKSGDAAEGPVFVPQGTQWTPRGMAQAAFAAAEHLQQEPGYAALPLQPALAAVQPDKSTAVMDDLVTLLGYSHVQQRYPARAWPVIRLVKASDKSPLLPDPASPVVLLGGDAVRLYDDPALGHLPSDTPAGQPGSAGFAQHLAWHLSLPLDVFTVPGDGSAAAEQWLKARPEESRRGRRFVVWVIEDGGLLR